MTVGKKNISIGKILEGRDATLVPGAPNALFARIIEDLGSSIMTPTETREKLKLKKHK